MKKKKEPRKTYVVVEGDRVLRIVEDTDEAKAILSAVESDDRLKTHVVETRVLPDGNLEHRKIKHIIHSGEFTESMAYDITAFALDMADIMIKKGIYSYDLLPHNYSFENGKWILYDFGSFSVNSKNVKTQIRGIFKISFAAFELLRLLSRKELKHYFLNRIKCNQLFKMLPFRRWLVWFLNMRYTQILSALGFHAYSYKFMRHVMKSYSAPKVNPYEFKEEKEIFEIINENSKGMTDAFCIGIFGANWALTSDNNISKNVYIDDYIICDEYYKIINGKNIAAAVLQALTKDKKISDKIKYRALYDEFTAERFSSELLVFDFNEIYDENYTISDFCKIISNYAVNSAIIKLNRDEKLCCEIENNFVQNFKTVTKKETAENIVLILNDKVYQEFPKIKYGNENRGPQANEQVKAVMEILNRK